MPRPHFATMRRLNDQAGGDFTLPRGLVDLRRVSVRSAEFASRPNDLAVSSRSGLSPSQRAGLRYEARVNERLVEEAPRLSASYLPGPWIRYHVSGGYSWCQPDGLLISPSRVVICEIKNTHVIDAYWQLRAKYEPVIRAMSPYLGREIYVVEFAGGGDALMPWPEQLNLATSLDELAPQYNLVLGFAK